MTATSIRFQPGDLVTARGREWVVMPETTDDMLMVRPVGGLDDEQVGIVLGLESVEPASFSTPSPEVLGDHNACRLLRDAAKLSTRAASGPFRSFGRIAVEPRPYQLVPLLMAMKLDPVRLLIADDVGVGKTVESCLVAKELLERGEADGLAVVCPPHLAEQWQRELREKFHIEAELVLRTTVNRLERGRRHAGESLFARHRFVIISIDYIKSEKRIDDFVNNCPNLVIVDEAHTATLAGGAGRSRQQRHELVRRLSEREDSHLLLVTATPHSGNESAFRSLVGLLDPSFSDLPEDLDGAGRESAKRRLARHLVQRKRGDVASYLGTTEFPTRLEKEETYSLSDEYRVLFSSVLKFAQELVSDPAGNRVQQRVRWWSALALLRALASSPAAAAATLRNRAANLAAANDAEADEVGRRSILDLDESDQEEAPDFTPGADGEDAFSSSERTRLRKLAEQADALRGPGDAKLKKLASTVKALVKDGHAPIIFCRFIDTAEYVAEHLRDALGKKAEVMSVTGTLPPSERESRILELGEHDSPVLVCTDCLSEGVNLQQHFDTVIHYDLSWNPTRHEQREGRVDRFGQPRDEVKVLTLYGQDNLIDVVILNVLLRKHRAIRSDLGVSIAIPSSTNEVIESLYDEVMREMQDAGSGQMSFSFEWSGQDELHAAWEERAEKASRSVFAQQTIDPTEVESEMAAIRAAIGDAPTVGRFLRDVLLRLKVPVTEKAGRVDVTISGETPRSLRNAIGRDQPFSGRFALPTAADELYLARTHPVVEGLASWTLDTALDPLANRDRAPIAARCGVSIVAPINGVEGRVAVLLLRLRHHLHLGGRHRTLPTLAEEILAVGFTGTPESPQWLSSEIVEAALAAPPTANPPASLASSQATTVVEGLPTLQPALEAIATQRAEELRDAHVRVRAGARASKSVTVEPVLPVDVLGAFVLIPRA